MVVVVVVAAAVVAVVLVLLVLQLVLGGGRGVTFRSSDEAKTRSKRTKEQAHAQNRDKNNTTPSNQTRRQAGGFRV